MYDDPTEQLKQYITEALAHGYTKSHITQLLEQAGWQKEHITAAFTSEHAEALPPIPTPPAATLPLPAFLNTPFAQSILLAFGLGFINMLVFFLVIPSPGQQIIDYVASLYSGWTISPVIIHCLIITLIIAIVATIALRFKLKSVAASVGLIAISLMGVLLSLIFEMNRIVGWRFSAGLLLAFPVSQAIWYCVKRSIGLQILYGVAVLVLFFFSVRVLNTGGL